MGWRLDRNENGPTEILAVDTRSWLPSPDRFASAGFTLAVTCLAEISGSPASFICVHEVCIPAVRCTDKFIPHTNMANESGDRRAFVLAALKGKGKAKKRSAEGPSSSTLKKASGKPMSKKQKLAAKKARVVTEEEVDEPNTGVKRLRQDALQWKLLSAQPEDFADFDDDIDVASDTDDKEAKKGTRKAKADPMAKLFDNEGGMMMLEEVDGVDVMWEEDGKGGKKAILIVRSNQQLFLNALCANYVE